MKQEPGSECIPGLISQQVERNKPHMTAKPVEVLQFLLRIVRAQGIDAPVLDPFAGGGSTGVAAAAMGMRCLLFEQVEGYCQTIADRLRCVKRSKTTGDVQHSLFGSR